MTYTIFYLRSVTKDFRRIPAAISERIGKAINALRENPLPEGCKKIHGYDDTFRIRIGDYRIIYEVKSVIRIITIVKIGHRRDAYRGL